MPTTLISPLTLNIPCERLRPHHRGDCSLVVRSMLRRRKQIIPVVRPTGNGATRLRPARKLPANPRPLFVNAAREGGLIQHRAALPRMVQEQQITAAVGSGRDIGACTQVRRLTVKHGNLVRFQPQDQRPTTAHRSALIHADAAGLFGREIQQRITPPLASTVSFSIRIIAVT